MEHVIFVPAIYHVDEISQLASFLSFIESRITVKDKKIILYLYSNRQVEDKDINFLKTLPLSQIVICKNELFSDWEWPYIEAITQHINTIKPHAVISISSDFIKSILARVAARFSCGFAVDCTDLIFDESTHNYSFLKPAYAGNINAEILVKNSSIVFATLKIKNVAECSFETIDSKVEIVESLFENFEPFSGRIKIIEKNLAQNIDNKLESAKIVIGVGRGIKDKENLKYAFELANILNGAVGVTRPLVDMGWLDKEYQIGQSGKIVSPQIYFAFGVSGAAHHICGIGNPKLIIAVNKNKDAQIFKIAHYGIVADATSAMKSFIKAFKSRLKDC
ncbi:electron transfer flavoprotein alpha subunit apoprotein [Caldicellulosiruptor bescii]|uniref:Electron transfer flavoprotein alpha subunit n=2 Tax=Caldicellulosiruptor bescii TaxID=31899 RepID=B9MRN0_CALBD|nr:electron transfer flavoprotein subunit alpha/FixB family protein [Caldicellulosiruptor bescii]ACM60334.1 Electron transfer flavoprotein alpha subunit [Caldicellulosiruptor bescii DSM 6725]PBC87748.1 electron transfer flavoprotein alpha subunit apoprotein [Caldicellulosiruptor bescii]PBC90680.1 electron transfer flavoprotein alpha subunit apoprotein [Caldicellulosiruptor bescii]PBD03887.1 electron transfer flavoprotein alpha subunit apoprotein [Caldicellulosiruptor bescii]PBD06478.1 electron